MILPMLLLAAGEPAPMQQTGGTLLIDRGRIDRQQAPQTPQPATNAPIRPKTLVSADGSNITIAGIVFRGAKAPAPVAKAARAWLGKKASPKNLTELAAALSDAYAQSNVALYTIAIPNQNFADGAVVVLLAEGSVARAQVMTPDKDGYPLLRARLTPLTQEKPLSRETWERQLTLMRAIPGLTFDTQLQDPAHTGDLVMTVTPKQKRSKFSGGFSSRGVDSLGDGSFDAKADFYGLLTDGDDLNLAASSASDFRAYRYAAGSYAAPIGASGLTLSANAGYLATRPRNVPIEGHATLAGASLAYPLIRAFHQSADLSIALDGLNSDNALFGTLFSSERTRAVRVAAGFADARTKRSMSISASISHGLDIFGARTTAPLSVPVFTKENVGGAFAQAIGQRMVLRVNASGQYSTDILPAAERFSVGGEAIGRAFDIGVLTGDRGAGGLAELAFHPVKGALFSQSEVYMFVDGAVLGVLPRGTTLVRTDYSLASAGAGFRIQYRDKAMLGLEAAHPIQEPYPGYDEDWRLAVSWRLSI